MLNKIYWLTGNPCAGKSTIGLELSKQLNGELLDGDMLRKLNNNGDFSKKGRTKHMLAVAHTAYLLSQYTTVIVALVSPYKKIREQIKTVYSNLVEIYVNCPIDVCKQRDVKGMYKKAEAGTIKNFTGVHEQHEAPNECNIKNTLTVNTDLLSKNDCVKLILDKFHKPIKYSLMIGRYQPPHAGHFALIQHVLDKGERPLVAIRNTPNNKDNPYSYKYREIMFRDKFGDKIDVIMLDDINKIVYGRDVGYGIEQIKLPDNIEQITATEIRQKTLLDEEIKNEM